jgi:hypothetical protein
MRGFWRNVQETGVLQLVIDDTVMEALESDNLTLQTMSGGKYVQVGTALSFKSESQQMLCLLFCCRTMPSRPAYSF